jgi:hypothetical protein
MGHLLHLHPLHHLLPLGRLQLPDMDVFTDPLRAHPAHQEQLVSSLDEERAEEKLRWGHCNFVPCGRLHVVRNDAIWPPRRQTVQHSVAEHSLRGPPCNPHCELPAHIPCNLKESYTPPLSQPGPKLIFSENSTTTIYRPAMSLSRSRRLQWCIRSHPQFQRFHQPQQSCSPWCACLQKSPPESSTACGSWMEAPSTSWSWGCTLPTLQCWSSPLSQTTDLPLLSTETSYTKAET